MGDTTKATQYYERFLCLERCRADLQHFADKAGQALARLRGVADGDSAHWRWLALVSAHTEKTRETGAH